MLRLTCLHLDLLSVLHFDSFGSGEMWALCALVVAMHAASSVAPYSSELYTTYSGLQFRNPTDNRVSRRGDGVMHKEQCVLYSEIVSGTYMHTILHHLQHPLQCSLARSSMFTCQRFTALETSIRYATSYVVSCAEHTHMLANTLQLSAPHTHTRTHTHTITRAPCERPWLITPKRNSGAI